jgi:hypothetical protein
MYVLLSGEMMILGTRSIIAAEYYYYGIESVLRGSAGIPVTADRMRPARGWSDNILGSKTYNLGVASTARKALDGFQEQWK